MMEEVCLNLMKKNTQNRQMVQIFITGTETVEVIFNRPGQPEQSGDSSQPGSSQQPVVQPVQPVQPVQTTPTNICAPFLTQRIWNMSRNLEMTLNCPVCYDDIRSATGMTLLKCGHQFHTDCMRNITTCPICRQG